MKVKSELDKKDKKRLLKLGFKTEDKIEDLVKSDTYYKFFNEYFVLILNPYNDFNDSEKGNVTLYEELEDEEGYEVEEKCEIEECIFAKEIYSDLEKLVKYGIIYKEK